MNELQAASAMHCLCRSFTIATASTARYHVSFSARAPEYSPHPLLSSFPMFETIIGSFSFLFSALSYNFLSSCFSSLLSSLTWFKFLIKIEINI